MYVMFLESLELNWHFYLWWSFLFWRRSICSLYQGTTSKLATYGKNYMTHFYKNTLHFLQSQRTLTLQTMPSSTSHRLLFPTHIYQVSEFSPTTYPSVTMWTWRLRKDRRSVNMDIDMETMVIKCLIAAQRSIETRGNAIWTNHGILTLSRLREATSNGHPWGMHRYVRLDWEKIKCLDAWFI